MEEKSALQEKQNAIYAVWTRFVPQHLICKPVKNRNTIHTTAGQRIAVQFFLVILASNTTRRLKTTWETLLESSQMDITRRLGEAETDMNYAIAQEMEVNVKYGLLKCLLVPPQTKQDYKEEQNKR